MPESRRLTWDPENLFAATAWFYSRYRPAYPASVIKYLVDIFSLNKQSRVLDLGCGTGHLALKLAPFASEVIAIDPLEEMLNEGRKRASDRRMKNIIWLSGESADLPVLADKTGTIDCTVIGRAFHWMDREQTLRDLYAITSTGGGLAIISNSGPLADSETPWKNILKQTVVDWLGEERQAGTAGVYMHPDRRHEEILEESDFQDIKRFTLKSRRKWSLDRIIGYLYSTSYASLPVLGDKKEPFEADVRKRLSALNPSGIFRETAETEIIASWK